jgi:hypothetical protein
MSGIRGTGGRGLVDFRQLSIRLTEFDIDMRDINDGATLLKE